MTPEQKFWQLLKPHVPGHVNRIENTVGNGIPDVNFCYKGKETWIELKAGSKLRDSQKIWHQQRALAGGRVFVIERALTVIRITRATELLDVYLEVERFPRPWDWTTIEAILKGEQ
jgi:hypothetical protein